jgi:heme exporter protein B
LAHHHTKQTLALLYKEFLLEGKQKLAFNSLLLYISATVFITALSFREGITIRVWFTAFWIINMFTAVQGVARSFIGESAGQQAYLYQLAHPIAIISAKLIYNILLMIAGSYFTLLLFIVFLLPTGMDLSLFPFVVLIGAGQLATALTLISAIASLTAHPATLMAVLSFPILFPEISLLIRLSDQAAGGVLFSKDVYYSLLVIGINVALSLLLFPFLWKK